MRSSLDSLQGRGNICNSFCNQQETYCIHSESEFVDPLQWRWCMQTVPTLCFLIRVKRIGTGFAVPDRPPANAPALGILTNTSLKQVEQSRHIRYRWPRCLCCLTTVDRANCVLSALLWATFSDSDCSDADVCDSFVPVINFSANAPRHSIVGPLDHARLGLEAAATRSSMCRGRHVQANAHTPLDAGLSSQSTKVRDCAICAETVVPFAIANALRWFWRSRLGM